MQIRLNRGDLRKRGLQIILNLSRIFWQVDQPLGTNKMSHFPANFPSEEVSEENYIKTKRKKEKKNKKKKENNIKCI